MKQAQKCHWLANEGTAKEKCLILTDMVCKKKCKCSFRETTAHLQKRMADFNERHSITEDI